ncbi:MAG: hypothetical protein M0Q14_08450 [Tissierellaceae bacterium]|nr:hypothetical protein [Tissierellaceae bacterium]
MDHNIETKNYVPTSSEQALLNITESSNIIKYFTLGIQPSKTILWTPELQKSIFVTSVQISAPLGVSIILSDGNMSFLSLKVTRPFNNAGKVFSSPFRLATDNSLSVSTSDEEILCDTFGAITATQVAYNGRSDFTNVNNAIGLSNGTLCSLNSSLLNQTAGRLILSYSMLPNEYKYLDIQQVIIKYYCRLNLTLAVGVSSMILYWRPDNQANWIELQEIDLSVIGTSNHLVNPLEHDITDIVLEASDPWDVINNLQTSFVGAHTGLGLGNTVQLDAIEIEICMSGKNAITIFGYEA